MQVVINNEQKVLLHGAEDNAEGAVVPTDAAVPSWAVDRDDLATLVKVDDDPWSQWVVPTDGAEGDVVVTLTAQEPDTDSGPGAAYTITQVVTVGPDVVVAAVQITADDPEPKNG